MDSAWGLLNRFQLEDLLRWLDWAERHAMHRYAHCNAEEWGVKRQWQTEIFTLASAQSQIRTVYELKTGSPPCKGNDDYDYVPSHLPPPLQSQSVQGIVPRGAGNAAL